MAERRQKIRGTTLQLDQEIGAAGLLAMDYEKNRLRLYDGIIMGGYEFLNATDIAAMYTLPARLNPTAVEISGAARSVNEARTNGYYSVTPDVTDKPAGAATVGLVHVVESEDGEVSQTYTDSGTGNAWFRSRKIDGTWVAWKRVVDLAYAGSDVFTAYNASRLGGELPGYYTAINARLGYTAANKAGDQFTGNVGVTGAIAASADITTDGKVRAAGIVQAGGASGAYLNTDGNIVGGVWGTSLGSWLASNKVTRGGDTMNGQLVMSAANIQMTRGGGIRYIHMDGNNIGFLSNVGGWTFRVDNDGRAFANLTVNAGNAQLNTDGNVYGSRWADWGHSNWAFDAINQRIERRAGEYADDRIGRVMSIIASQGAGAVGTYALLKWRDNLNAAGPGTQVDGGSLQWSNPSGYNGGVVGYGSWRLCAYHQSGGNPDPGDGRTGIYLRYQ